MIFDKTVEFHGVPIRVVLGSDHALTLTRPGGETGVVVALEHYNTPVQTVLVEKGSNNHFVWGITQPNSGCDCQMRRLGPNDCLIQLYVEGKSLVVKHLRVVRGRGGRVVHIFEVNWW